MEMNCVNKIVNDKYKPKKCLLDELVHFERGRNITAAEMQDGEIPVVSAGLSYSGYHNKANVKGPAITISASGANSGVVLFHNYDFWAADCSYSAKTTNMLFSKHFLRYLQPIITNLQRGAAQPHVYAKNVNHLKVEIPTPEIQDKIANILENYDKLIENNNKRIKILEDLAESQYKEWFIRFRFPEHEKVEFVNGIPKGWKVIKTKDICNVFTGKKDVNQTDDSGLYAFFSCSPESFYSNDYIFDGKAIIIAGNGSYTGRTMYYDGKFDLYQRTYAVVVNNDLDDNIIYYLYLCFKYGFEPTFSGGTRGSAIPYIVRKDITDYKICYQKETVLIFSKIMRPIFLLTFKLKKENELLMKQRDSLLPRLMSGKLSVEERR